MATVLMRALDAAFGHPRGLAGKIGGALMARGNAEQERWAVRAAKLAPGQSVLLLGDGPGLGLEWAARAVGSAGRALDVDPSAVMRAMATARCADHIASGIVEVRAGTTEQTGCLPASMDAAISVNNIMLWDRPAAFSELRRVLRLDGRLVVTVHRHVLSVPPERLRAEAEAAGFTDVSLRLRARRFNSPAVELLARAPAPS
jgi:arsenite methyltransferase